MMCYMLDEYVETHRKESKNMLFSLCWSLYINVTNVTTLCCIPTIKLQDVSNVRTVPSIDIPILICSTSQYFFACALMF